MRVHPVWGLGMPQFGLEKAGAARYFTRSTSHGSAAAMFSAILGQTIMISALEMCVLVKIAHSNC
jgi:hypothetical protein